MPIQTGDIKLFKSDTMSDIDEGGGAITGSVVVDGQSNNIFEDISTLDRVYGAVHMRKLFPAVSIQTQDKYFGAHAIISKLPTDTKIGVNLFNTKDWFDRRLVAQTRVENYRAKGANYNGYLWATQWQGSKTISIFQNTGAPLPKVGEVLYLTQLGDTEFQYVKVVNMTYAEQTFTDPTGAYTRMIINAEISEALSYDFVGSEITRFDGINPQATIKTTVLANAAKYYSARPLAVAGVTGDREVRVDSIYSQLIPSSLQEDAIADANAAGDRTKIITSSQVGETFTALIGPDSSVYSTNGIVPGSLSIPVTGGTLTDSAGKIYLGSSEYGTIDYASGVLQFNSSMPNYGPRSVTITPAGAPGALADTSTLSVTDQNRGYVWVNTISPPPQPGSLRVSFMALGEWYDLHDDATGGIAGDEAGIGTGTVNYTTGTASLTLAALPDAETEIVFSWGKNSTYTNRSNFAPDPVTFELTLAQKGVIGSSVVITWNDGAARTVTCTAAGVLSGDGVGTVNLTTGVISLKPNTLPFGGTTFTVNYNYGEALSTKEKTWSSPALSGGNLILDVQESIELNSLEIEFPVALPAGAYQVSELIGNPINPTVYATDNGAGALNTVAGTVDYVSGIITTNTQKAVTVSAPIYTNVYEGSRLTTHFGNLAETHLYRRQLTGYTPTPYTAAYQNTGTVKARYRTAGSSIAGQETFNISSIGVDLTTDYAEKIVTGSVLFSLGGRDYFDRLGSLYYNIDRATGAATYAGTIDYQSGTASINDWVTSATNAVTLKSLLTDIGARPVDDVNFRVPGAPVKSLSLQIRATPIDGGGEINATSDANGIILGTDIDGYINYETGSTHVRFGQWVTAAGNEGEDWYNANAVISGEIFRPRLVHADTIFYNAVSQTFLPLDSGILGLNPVRLPQDGRVPVYAPGDVVVVLHDQITSGTYSSNQVVNLGRIRIAKLTIRDAGNNPINAYTADLDTGVVTFGDLSGISQPLTITDRIEDMVLVTDVQITGKLTLSQPITHDFIAPETLVANAVIYGDLYAHTSIPFDQQTWTGVWSDQLIGSSVTAQYNNVQYPIVVDNASCIEERWAMIFTSATTVDVVGEHVGEIISNAPISSDIAPINPNTLQPYFTIPFAGWGAGWSSGNVLRFNTSAANAPLWIIQSVAQGQATGSDYGFCVEFRGDIDTP